MSSSNDMTGANKTVKPQYPDCNTAQYAGTSKEGSVSPDYLGVSYDQYNNEIAEDRPYHMNNLGGDMGRFGFNNPSATSISGMQKATGRQYADDWNGGYQTYGQNVDANTGAVEKITVDNSRADRGKES